MDYVEDDGWDFCRELWQLDLRGNELKIVEREILRKLPALTHLDLRDNLISHIEADGAFLEVRRTVWEVCTATVLLPTIPLPTPHLDLRDNLTRGGCSCLGWSSGAGTSTYKRKFLLPYRTGRNCPLSLSYTGSMAGQYPCLFIFRLWSPFIQ